MNECDQKKLHLLTKYQIGLVLQTGTVRAWMALGIIFIALLIFGTRVERFENGVIWFVFGNESPYFSNLAFSLATRIFIVFGITLFFPVGLATSVQALLDAPVVNYFLARPISRSSVVFSNVLGVAMAYLGVMGIFIASLWLTVGIKSGIWSLFNIWHYMLFIPVGIGLYTLLVVGIFVVRSLGIGLMLNLLYSMFLAYYMAKRTAGIAWWEKTLNVALDIMSYLLPPLARVSDFVKPTSDGVLNPFEVFIHSICSIFVLYFIASRLYRRMEF